MQHDLFYEGFCFHCDGTGLYCDTCDASEASCDCLERGYLDATFRECDCEEEDRDYQKYTPENK